MPARALGLQRISPMHKTEGANSLSPAMHLGNKPRITFANPQKPEGGTTMNALRDESNTGSDIGTIPAYFRNPVDAEKAVNDLNAAGFSKQNIGVALQDRHDEGGTAKSSPSGWTERLRSLFSANERQEYQSDDAIDVLEHMGVSESEGRQFKNALRSGGVLITVNAGTRSAEARSILKRSNAILSSSELGSFAIQGTDTESRNIDQQRLQLLGETLRVHKDRVQRGAVKLRKEVVSERQNVEVPVTREEVVIERRPAEGRPTARTDFEDGKEIKVPLSEDRVRVEKRPIVREEVAVGKREVQSTRNVSDDVKHEELRVEKEGDVNVDQTGQRKRA
jgi:uncharacterized protein (TIGR02271 family)